MDEWQRDDRDALAREGSPIDRSEFCENLLVVHFLCLAEVALRALDEREVEDRVTASAIGVGVELMVAHLAAHTAVCVQGPAVFEILTTILASFRGHIRNEF